MDIRYFPKQGQEDIDRLMVKLGGKPAPDKPPGPSRPGEKAAGTADVLQAKRGEISVSPKHPIG